MNIEKIPKHISKLDWVLNESKLSDMMKKSHFIGASSWECDFCRVVSSLRIKGSGDRIYELSIHTDKNIGDRVDDVLSDFNMSNADGVPLPGGIFKFTKKVDYVIHIEGLQRLDAITNI